MRTMHAVWKQREQQRSALKRVEREDVAAAGVPHLPKALPGIVRAKQPVLARADIDDVIFKVARRKLDRGGEHDATDSAAGCQRCGLKAALQKIHRARAQMAGSETLCG